MYKCGSIRPSVCIPSFFRCNVHSLFWIVGVAINYGGAPSYWFQYGSVNIVAKSGSSGLYSDLYKNVAIHNFVYKGVIVPQSSQWNHIGNVSLIVKDSIGIHLSCF